MSIRAVYWRADPSQPLSAGDRDLSRVLSLLEGGQDGALTIAALRERGIGAPALTLYELQLAGYEIERVPYKNADGHTSPSYRLCAAPAPATEPAYQLKDVRSDEIQG